MCRSRVHNPIHRSRPSSGPCTCGACPIDYDELDGWAGLKLLYAIPTGNLTADLPVSTMPTAFEKIQFCGLQIDPLGNRSGFARVAP